MFVYLCLSFEVAKCTPQDRIYIDVLTIAIIIQMPWLKFAMFPFEQLEMQFVAHLFIYVVVAVVCVYIYTVELFYTQGVE